MSNKIKELVSKKKKRFKQDGYNLDLSYIKPNIVAMGFPADSVEAIYRNDIEDVYKFFEERHHGHYKIYNLCMERMKSYDNKRFPKIAHFPFHDHNAPPFQLIKPFCEDVGQFLEEDDDNVVVIHCKAGKGRTGVMIVSYLLHEQIYTTVQPALQFYGEARTRDRKGVTIPSQRRYVYYYGDLIKKKLEYETKTLLLTKIKLIGLPFIQTGSLGIAFSLSLGYVKLYSGQYEQVRRDLEEKELCPESPMLVCDDIKIEIFTKQLTKERLCQFWLNSFFISQRTKTGEEDDCAIFGEGSTYIVSLSKSELDKINKDKKDKIVPKDFRVEIHFIECGHEVGDCTKTAAYDADSDPDEDTDLDEDDENGELDPPTPVRGRPTMV